MMLKLRVESEKENEAQKMQHYSAPIYCGSCKTDFSSCQSNGTCDLLPLIKPSNIVIFHVEHSTSLPYSNSPEIALSVSLLKRYFPFFLLSFLAHLSAANVCYWQFIYRISPRAIRFEGICIVIGYQCFSLPVGRLEHFHTNLHFLKQNFGCGHLCTRNTLAINVLEKNSDFIHYYLY